MNEKMMILVLLCLSKSTADEIITVSQSNFPEISKDKNCMFLYVEDNEECTACEMYYHKFLTVAQTFQEQENILFGRVSDESLAKVFEVDSFPEVVYYELGSATPKRYRGDITADALTDLVIKVMRGNFENLKRHYSAQLTIETFEQVLYNSEQYRLVMLHEEEDEDEIKTFEELAKTYDNDKEIVIARIDITKQESLRDDFDSVNYPCFYWYEKGEETKRKRYGGEMILDQMIHFINKETGLQRNAGGSLGHKAGLLKPIDDLLDLHAKNIYEVKGLDILISQIEKISAKLEDESKELAEFYINCIEEIQEDNTVDSLGEQRNRLFRRMDDDNVGPVKRDMLIKKTHIVNKFVDVVGLYLLGDIAGGGSIPSMIKGADDEEEEEDSDRDQIYFHDEF